jgi:hypothetical protein
MLGNGNRYRMSILGTGRRARFSQLSDKLHHKLQPVKRELVVSYMYRLFQRL